MSEQDWNPSQYYQADFLASHSVQPGSEEARKMTVTSGLRCLELYRKSGPVGSLARMLLGSSVWRSTRCFLTWKESATPAKRLLFRLAPSMPRTDEIAVPFWPTPTTPRPHDSENTAGKYIPSQKQKDLSYAVAMWPTPTARDSKCANSMEHLATGNHVDQLSNAVKWFMTPTAWDAKGLDYTPRKDATLTRSVLLSQQVAMLPTPTARDWKSPDLNSESKRFSQKTELNSTVGGQLNPTWVEWLMGFPSGWTDLDASETLSCPSSSSHSLMR